jgi:hypothetical protein
MGLSRRQFTQEFKLAAVRRLESEMEGFSSNHFSWKKHTLFVIFRNCHSVRGERTESRLRLRSRQGAGAEGSQQKSGCAFSSTVWAFLRPSGQLRMRKPGMTTRVCPKMRLMAR